MDLIQQATCVRTLRKCFLQVAGFTGAFYKIADLEIKFVLKRFFVHIYRYRPVFSPFLFFSACLHNHLRSQVNYQAITTDGASQAKIPHIDNNLIGS
jgi:hypothetical protein